MGDTCLIGFVNEHVMPRGVKRLRGWPANQHATTGGHFIKPRTNGFATHLAHCNDIISRSVSVTEDCSSVAGHLFNDPETIDDKLEPGIW